MIIYRFFFVARCLLGGMLVYMGLSKTMDPVNFLKLLREYDVLASPWPLNAVAALLPWFEVCCGFFLLCNVARRGAAVVVGGMFLFFSVAIVLRAFELQSAGQLAFCAVRFDCGCGAGEVNVCRKLLENGAWFALSCWLVLGREQRRGVL